VTILVQKHLRKSFGDHFSPSLFTVFEFFVVVGKQKFATETKKMSKMKKCYILVPPD
jgi:hypothetical protein